MTASPLFLSWPFEIMKATWFPYQFESLNLFLVLHLSTRKLEHIPSGDFFCEGREKILDDTFLSL